MIKKLVFICLLDGEFFYVPLLADIKNYSMEIIPYRYLMIPTYVSLRMYIPPLLTLRDRTVSIIW